MVNLKTKRKHQKLGDTQRRHTAKDLTEGRSIQEPGKHHMQNHKLQEKSLKKMKVMERSKKYSKSDLSSANAHMKKHGG